MLIMFGTNIPDTTGYQTIVQRVDGICGSVQNGTVKNRGMENAGMDISARCGRGGQCGRNNTV